MMDLLSAAHSCHRILLCSQYVLCIPAIDDVCYLWYGPIIYNTSMCHCCMMLALLPMMDVYSVIDITQYMISKLHIVHTVKVTVWNICHRPMEQVNDWYCTLRMLSIIVSSHDACASCYHSMIHVPHVIGLCIMLRCNTVLYEVWGPPVSLYINTLWQPDRLTWSVYSITSVCSEMISYMLSCNWYSHMMLSIYDSCSPCYRSMITDTMRYHQ